MAERADVALNVHYCAKCGAKLISRKYEDGGMGVLYETCICPSCNATWQTAQFTSGEVRIAEIAVDDESPEEMIPLE